MAKVKTKQPLTTAQQLGSLIKSARDIMRKDKGLNGDLDRLPMLTWVMFLKFLDDLETDPRTEGRDSAKTVQAHNPIALPLAGLGGERRRHQRRRFDRISSTTRKP